MVPSSVYEQPPCEKMSFYRPGGYHPVHIGDTFHGNTYEVVHKLGYGQFSTVWLVKDRKRAICKYEDPQGNSYDI